MNELERLARHYIYQVWEQGDGAAAKWFLSPEIRIVGVQALEVNGLSDFRSFHSMIWSQIDHLHFDTRLALADPPWVSHAGTITLRERRTGTRLTERCHCLNRFDGKRIVETEVFIDFLAIFEKVGRLPPRVFDRCLAGERLGIA
ncbi:nuclear transport factor 2 family protein [Roseivivax sediminis]|uniref:SnoaL-like domain-containing protein n=1 Tax=Roseivivax sediminis TaxID=936889 RepID=A0A1I2DJ93_9RHOB|nr:nuclear transport factor 2 family protein [Roseivivax sediminis]SFE80596.1 SnoaL-like domain-containing protein [Roseivivax sediminis]